jgi:hypothetical protein
LAAVLVGITAAGRAGAVQIIVAAIQRRLIASITVDRRHNAVQCQSRVIEGFDQRREAIGSVTRWTPFDPWA